MSRFSLERREQASFGTFFPDPVTIKREVWGRTMVDTNGIWERKRLVIGDLAGAHNRIAAIAREYSIQRKRMPEIDAIRLFEAIPAVRATPLEYYDYAGRIESISRESVFVQTRGGERYAFNRDGAVGFRGIIVRSEEPWDLTTYAATLLARARMALLHSGQAPFSSGLTIDQPWVLRDALERQLTDLVNLAWAEYTAEPTLDRMTAVMQVEEALYAYVANTLGWAQLAGQDIHAEPLQFPDAPGAIQLWLQDRVAQLNYDETDAWYGMPRAEKGAEITALRRAYLTNGRCAIMITTNPHLYSLEHPRLPIAHHMITYDPVRCPIVRARDGSYYLMGAPGFARPQPNLAIRHESAFIGQRPDDAPWNGIDNLPVRDGWAALTSEQYLPEPKLTVRTRPLAIPRDVSERIEAALTAEKPVLVQESLNNAVAPILVLPRMWFKVHVQPLFDSGHMVRPLQEGNTVSGWATRHCGHAGSNEALRPIGATPGPALLLDGAPPGFLSTPAEGRPLREAVITELLPSA